jgi:predicted P-loop ATPase
MSDRRPIDFVGLAAALLDRVESLLPRWLPAGIERNARWYVGDFDGSPGESANVNMRTGQWIDNASPDEDKGGDLTSLYARIRGLSNAEAARELIRDMGWGPVQASAHHDEPARRPADRRPEPPPDALPGTDPSESPRRRKSTWRPIAPVPPKTPPPKRFLFSFHDKKRGEWIELEAARTWSYDFEGEHYGYVARFERVNSDGETVKDTVPFTWCVDESDGRGSMRWHQKQWEPPRPLYVPATLLSGDPSRVPVVVVEGEKCAEAGHRLLGHEFDFVSWPGGGNSWSFAAWRWLMGRTVYLWADCDAQRERLTKAEREAGVDPASKPLRPENKQPGIKTMVHIGALLMAEHGCTVYSCNIPKPGEVAEGWDIADAIAEGWDADRARAFIRSARVFEPPQDEARAKVQSSELSAGAGADMGDPSAWRKMLLETDKGAIKAVRENAVLALDGLRDVPDTAYIAGPPDLAGIFAFNEFTNDVIKRRAAPWGSPEGVLTEVDDLRMGEYLVRKHWLPSMPRGTLEEAIKVVADRHRFHPVRSWLQGLKWDKHKRLATWLRRVCLAEDEWDDADPLQQYLARVGTWYLMGMCARVLDVVRVNGQVVRGPGTKFDYMLILEGPQGLRKSTLLRTLAGEYFADTGLVLGDKDSYQQLQGCWLYEIPELDAFSKADVMKIKAYIASQEDYFRASFDRRARKYPRQVVFGGTTNEDHYLTDPTGNRRFWPVKVTRLIDIDWVIAHREQLLAEAMHRVMAGARMYPTPAEELELFAPQQQARAVENAIESAIARFLYSSPAPGQGREDGTAVDEVSLVELLGKLGIGIEKLGPGRFHEKQAAAALRRLGWEEGRSSKPGRPRVYRRPPERPVPPPAGDGRSDSTRPTQGASTSEGDDDCPF